MRADVLTLGGVVNHEPPRMPQVVELVVVGNLQLKASAGPLQNHQPKTRTNAFNKPMIQGLFFTQAR